MLMFFMIIAIPAPLFLKKLPTGKDSTGMITLE
jgi:hypothetical protein